MAAINVAPQMTSSVLPAPNVVTYSGQYSATTHAAYQVFGRSNNYWIQNFGTEEYVQLDLGSGNEIEVLHFSISNNTIPEPNRCPKDFTMQGSNNDSDWDILGTYTGETDWGNGEVRHFELTSTASYRYYKIVVTDNNGDTYLIINEIQLFDTEFEPEVAIEQSVLEVLSTGSPEVAVEQSVLEVLSSGIANTAVQQLVTEVLTQNPADTAIQQFVVEVLVPAPAPLTQVHQLVSEVVTTGDPKTNLNQLVAEVVTTGDPVLQTHQLAVEVVWKPVLDGEVQNHQFVLEVMDTGSPEVAVQQFVTEVMDTGSPEVAVQQFVLEVMQLTPQTSGNRRPIVFIYT